MTYEEALAYIASLEPRGWRLGLDRMAEFVRRAGLESSIGGPSGPQYIHVTGTNGKGSTTAFLQSLLVESGYRTGAFFSPYVVDPRERVQVGRSLIPKQELADITEALIPVAEEFTNTRFGGITEFEFKTAIGFECWRRNACEWVALEVGLGGRLDATNVVRPRACVITSISLDHTSILGETVEEIALEKAGIVKPGVPVVIGEVPPGALAVIERIAKEREAPVWRFGVEVLADGDTVFTPRREHTGLRPSLYGAKQRVNLALAVAAMDAAGATEDEDALRRGASLAWAPGRFQVEHVEGRPVVFDGAHNPESALVLSNALRERFPGKRWVLVTNMLQGHELGTFFEPLLPGIARVHVAPIDFHRARAVSDTATELKALGADVAEHAGVAEALREALAEVCQDQVVVVTGSFYLVGEALRSLRGER